MDIRQAVEQLKVWSQGGQRAPHKPLLLLLVFGMYASGHPRSISFAEIEEPLRKLLTDFGPPRKSIHPEYPFWHLGSDGIWQVQNVDVPPAGIGSISPTRNELLAANAQGGLVEECYQQIKRPELLKQVVESILEINFPETLHEDILSSVGLPGVPDKQVAKRDAGFRSDILLAYRNECAICGFSSRMGDALIGVEAAHIKWHQAGGPDTRPNGIALCSLHHKLFDFGMITVSEDYKIHVSERATGTAIFDHLVTDFHDQLIRMPIRASYQPAGEFLDWHKVQVFKPPSREPRTAQLFYATQQVVEADPLTTGLK